MKKIVGLVLFFVMFLVSASFVMGATFNWINPSSNNTLVNDLLNITINVTNCNLTYVNFNGTNYSMLNSSDIWYYLWNTSLNLDGIYNITSICNNSNSSTLFNTTVDNTFPFISNLRSNDTDNITNNNINLNFTVWANDSNLANVTLNGSLMNTSDGNNFYLITTPLALGCVSNGNCTLTAIATDLLGQSASTNYVLMIDSSAPVFNSQNFTGSPMNSVLIFNDSNSIDKTCVLSGGCDDQTFLSFGGTGISRDVYLWYNGLFNEIQVDSIILNTSFWLFAKTRGGILPGFFYLINTSWTETDNIMPSNLPNIIGRVNLTSPGWEITAWYNLTLSSDIRSWFNESIAYYGMAFICLGGNCLSGVPADITSSEGVNKPYYNITWIDYGVSDGDNVGRNDVLIEFILNVSDNNNVASVTLNGTAMNNTGDIWWLISNASDLGCVNEGICVLPVVAADGAGNTNTTNFTLIIDLTNPDINNLSTNDTDDISRNDVNLNFTVWANDSNIRQVKVGNVPFRRVANAMGSGWYTIATNASALGCFNESICTIEAVAIDQANNRNYTYYNLTIDLTNPDVYGLFFDNIYLRGIQILNASVNDTNSVFLVRFNLTNSSGFSLMMNGNSKDGYYWVNNSFNTSAFADGIYSIYVHAADFAGNENNSYFENIVIDNTLPAIYGEINRTLQGNSIIYNNDSVYLNATVYDLNFNTSWIEINWNNGTINNYTVNRTGNISYYIINYPGLMPFNNKTISWRYHANDLAGNYNFGSWQGLVITNRVPLFNFSNNISDIGWMEDGICPNCVNLSDVFYDLDLDDLNYTATVNPSNITVTIDNNTGLVSFASDTGFFGYGNVTFFAWDPWGANAFSNTMNLTVYSLVNHNPVFASLPNFNFSEDTNYSFDLSAYCSDPDPGQICTNFSVDMNTNSSLNIIVNNITGWVVFNPSMDWWGLSYVRFRAQDNNSIPGMGVSNNFIVNVTPVNDTPTAPVLLSPADGSIVSTLGPINLSWNASYDGDGDNITYYVFHSNNSNNITLNTTTNGTSVVMNGLIDDMMYYWYVIASDGYYNSSNSTIWRYNSSINNSPTIDTYTPAGLNPNMNENSSLNFTTNCSDLDNDPLSYQWILDSVLQAATQNWTYFADFNSSGIRNVTFICDDGTGLNDSVTWMVNVANVNRNPVLNAIGNLTATEDSLFTYNATGSDPDNDSLTFTDNTSLFTIGFTTGTISFTPVNADVGNHSINISISDGNGGSDSEVIVLTVVNTNDAPVLTPIGTLYAVEDSLFLYDVNATDVDIGDVLTFSDNSSLFVIDALTGLINFTPVEADVGNHSINITVTDSTGASDSEIITLVVNNTNDCPNWTNALPDIWVNEDSYNDSINLYNYFNDTDNNTLIFYFAINSSNVSVVENNGTMNVSASADWYGNTLLNVTASDGMCNASDDGMMVIFMPVNDEPVLGFINDIFVTEGDLVVITPNATDIDSNNLTYYFSSPLNASGEWQTNSTDSGVYIVNVAVDDNDGGTDSQNVTITVYESTNFAPNITGLPDLNLTEDSGFNDDLINLSAYASDINGDNLTFSIINQTNNSVVDCAVGLDGFVDCTTQADQYGYSDITTEVSDGNLTDTDVFRVNVINVNDCPNWTNALPDIWVNEDSYNDSINLYDYFNDIDNNSLMFYFNISNASVNIVESNGIMNISASADWFGNALLNVTASDGMCNASDDGMMVIFMPVNDEPVLGFINDIFVTEGDLVVITPNATDIDSNNLTYYFSSPLNASGEWQTGFADSGVYIVNVAVDDNDGGTDSQNVTITVIEFGNRAPNITGLPDINLTEDSGFNDDLINLSAYASDPDGEVLSYSIINQTNNSVVDCVVDLNGFVDCTTQADQYGSSDITVEVSDGNLTNTDMFLVTVVPVNDAPVWNPVPSDQTIDEDTSLSYDVNATDVEGDNISYYVNDSEFNMDVNSGLLTWNPAANWNGVRSILIIASDGIVNTTQAIDVIVNPVNDAPIIDVPDQVLEEDSNLNLNLNDYSSDIDGDSLSYYITNEDVNEVDCDIVGSTLSIIPAADWNGVGSCGLIVSDSIVNVSDSFNIIVTSLNDGPSLEPINDIAVDEGELVEVIANASDPDPFDVLSYSINDSRFNQTGDIFRWQTTGLDDGNYSFRINVTDSGGLSDYEDFMVIVLNTLDEDNDNVSDENDTLVGSVDDINTSISDLEVLANGSGNLTSYLGVYNVEFRDSDGTIFEFEFNFSSECVLNLSGIIINKISLGGVGGVVIYGVPSECISEPGKTAYLDDLSADNIVCIKDNENVVTITEVSSGCDGEDETILLCDGKWYGRYRCTDLGDEYMVEGLEHSAIREFGCMEKWECSNWSGCEDKKQSRSCVDLNECGTGFYIPAVVQSCKMPEARLQIDRIRWSEYVKAGDDLELTVDLNNKGDMDLESVTVQAIIPELGIRKRIGPFDISDGSSEFRRILIYIPKDTKPGEYDVRISISNDKVRRIKHRVITVI